MSTFLGVGASAREVPVIAAVAVALAHVAWGNPTRDKLVSPEVREPVATTTRRALDAWTVTQPALAAALRTCAR